MEETVQYEGRGDELKIFRTQAVIKLSPWKDKSRLMLEISPAVPGTKGQPKAGEKRYEYDKGIRISFTMSSMLQFAYDLGAIIATGEGEIKKYADMSKVSTSDDKDKKTLSVQVVKDSIGFALFKGDDKVNVAVAKSDAYAIVKYIEFVYQYFLFAAMSTTGASNGSES